MDDVFLHMSMANVPYLSDKYKFAPTMKLEEEQMHQHLVLEKHGRVQLGKFLIKTDGGGHID